MKQYIRLSEAEFDRLRPLNGNIIVAPEQDVTNIQVDGKKLFFDGSFSPENNQVVVNKVVKVSDSGWRDSGFSSDMLLVPGDLVWVNYFSVLQALSILVYSDKPNVKELEYLMIPYRQCYMGYCETEEGHDYVMLNDYILLDPIVKEDTNPLVIDSLKKKVSKRYYKVERVPMYGSFNYEGSKWEYVRVKEGDIAFLLDSNQFKLEHWPHYLYDKRVHYVTRVQKVLLVVEEVDESVEVF